MKYYSVRTVKFSPDALYAYSFYMLGQLYFIDTTEDDRYPYELTHKDTYTDRETNLYKGTQQECEAMAQEHFEKLLTKQTLITYMTPTPIQAGSTDDIPELEVEDTTDMISRGGNDAG